MEKKCEWCGDAFKKKPRDSALQWENRAYCSIPCANKVSKTLPPHLSFWKYTIRMGEFECWPWSGVTDQHGYGRINFMTLKFKAHRVSYEMFIGPIPDGNVICHKCDNPNCVNPKHLFAGTQKQNMMDASSKGRLNPKSLRNLRPGMAGVHGAGPLSNGDIEDVG